MAASPREGWPPEGASLAQAGGKHQDAKVMTGFGSAGVLEAVEDYRGDAYRAVYTVKFA